MRWLLLLPMLTAATVGAQPYTLLPDIVYHSAPGVDPALLSLDVYQPLGDGPFPVVVFVHGGGWFAGDKVSAVHEKATWLTAQGVLFVSVNYRLSPLPTAAPDPNRIAFPTHPEDVGRAVDAVRANASAWGGDASRLALMGHSAGAHLAALVGTDPAYTAGGAPTCVVALDTNAYDVPFFLGTGASPDQAEIYVNAFTDVPAVQADASPITHVAAAPETAFLVVHQDHAVRSATATRFLDALQSAGHAASALATDGLSHQQINTLLGTAAAPTLTAAVGDFLGGCLGLATDTAPAPSSEATTASPNPTSGRLRLRLPPDGAPYRLRVLDRQGRTVVHRRHVASVLDLDLARLAPGVYTVVARGRGHVVRRRVTVVR